MSHAKMRDAERRHALLMSRLRQTRELRDELRSYARRQSAMEVYVIRGAAPGCNE